MTTASTQKPAAKTATATITSLTHDGRGVAHVDGKAVFIDEALPGETVTFLYTSVRRDYAEGRALSVQDPSPQRAEPPCPHYGVCGGCNLQHVRSELQIGLKQTLLQEQLKRIGKVEAPAWWPPLTGPAWGYRRKARMGVKHVAKKNRVLVGFRERRHPYLADILACPVMHPSVGGRLTALGDMIMGLSIRDHIPQIEVAVGEDDCVLALRVLSPPTPADIGLMRQFGHQHGLRLCLQSKGPDTIAPLPGEPPATPSYSLPEHGITFSFRPAMFTQVNLELNRLLVERALEALEPGGDDTVLDLYCGLGNFTLPIAKRAGAVVGVDGDLPLVEHALANARANGIGNVAFHAANLSQPLAGLEWAGRQYRKVLLDPSRAGAAEVLPYLKAWRPERVVYISCNPATLARDAGALVHGLGYRLLKAGVMDMFPQTAHVESIALFAR